MREIVNVDVHVHARRPRVLQVISLRLMVAQGGQQLKSQPLNLANRSLAPVASPPQELAHFIEAPRPYEMAERLDLRKELLKGSLVIVAAGINGGVDHVQKEADSLGVINLALVSLAGALFGGLFLQVLLQVLRPEKTT